MKNKLSLDAFKAMADATEEKGVLEKVNGGAVRGYCHGWLGSANKWLDEMGL
ncbi:hypothetical protein D9V96_018720 [Zobellia laminariae]|uniref:hypothetical protein n=1 Tax=Zobellia laminariae TaxID=248906 RepID=UPI0012D922AC